MFRLPRFLVAFALVLLAGIGPTFAEVDGFTISDVPAEATADSAAAARDIALAQGQRDALSQLLQRLTAPADAPKLPKVTDDMVTRTVRTFEVQSERTSPTRYVAKLKVIFRRDAVLDLLTKSNVAFTRPADRPMVVLPVWRTAGGPILWEDGNPWKEAWAARDPSADLVPLLVPPGDLQDIRTIQAAQAEAGDPPALTALAQRYDADTIIVAEATLAPGGNKLDVTLRRAGPTGVANSTESVALDPALTEPGKQMAAAADEIARRIEEGTKEATLVPTGAPGSEAVTVRIGSLQDWIAVRQRLRAVPAVSRVEVVSLSTGDARIILHYVGDPASLANTLNAQGLALATGPDGPEMSLSTGGPVRVPISPLGASQ
jgi:hypothetical protein